MALPPHLAKLEDRLASRFDEAIAEYRRALEEQIRRDSEARFAALAQIPAPSVTEWLGESQLGELDLVPRQAGAREALDRLASAMRRLDGARTQAEALDALLDGARDWADRVALILARDRGLTGWADRGFEAEPIAGRELEWNTTLRERLLASRGCLRLDAELAGEVLAEFGCLAAGAAVVVPMVLRDHIAALVWADRRDGEPELVPLQVLVHSAGQRLELQALSERAFSPTLWEGAEAPGAPLPLWSVLAPAAAEPDLAEVAETEPEIPLPAEPVTPPLAEPAAPAVAESETPAVAELEPAAAAAQEPAAAEEAPGEELGAELWQAEGAEPVAEAPASEVGEEPEAEEAAEAIGFEAYAEPADLTGEVMPPETSAAVEPEVEPQPEFELESVEPSAAEVAEAERWEPEPEAEGEPAKLIEAAAGEPSEAETPAEPEPAVDPHGTVRMEMPAVAAPELAEPEAAREAPSLEPPAEPATTAPSAAGTQEVEAPAVTEEEAADVTEDATVLSARRPPVPEAPAPDAPAEPPTWSAMTPAAPPAPAESPMERTGSRFGRSTEVSPPPDVSGPGLAFLAGRTVRSAADPAHEEAKRLARLLISEIRLYNEEQVLEGRRNRDLYHRLKEDIDRSRQIYEERVDATVRDEADYFQQELVRSLAGGDARALGI